MSLKKIHLLVSVIFIFQFKTQAQWLSKTTLNLPGLHNGVIISDDFNADSKPDLMISGFDGQQFLNRIYFNKLASNNYISISLTDTITAALSLNYNGDELQDLIFVTKNNKQAYLSIYQNKNSSFEKVNSIVNAYSYDSIRISIIDYNKDLYPDLLVATLKITKQIYFC